MAQRAPGQPSGGAQPGVQPDPYGVHNFKLEIQDVTEGYFKEVSGLAIRVATIRHRGGGIKQPVRVMPGPTEFANVTLSSGMTASNQLWTWMLDVANGTVRRKNVSIVMLGSDGISEVKRWDLIAAFPCEWRGPELNALRSEMAVESVTLAFESLQQR
jgi:phage tail-like protein